MRRKHLTLWGTGGPGRFTVPNPPGISNLTETQLNEGWGGWAEAHELPASQQARSLAGALAAPLTAAERQALRREAAEEKAKGDRVADAAAPAENLAFAARVNGTPPRNARNVLAEAAEEPFRDRETAARRRAAIDALKPLGLADVITGGSSGVILDFNMGILEPPRDVAQQDELERQYVAGRAERIAEQGREVINRSRQQLQERRRAPGLASRARTAATYLESCTAAAGGPGPVDDWERERQFRAAMGGVSYR